MLKKLFMYFSLFFMAGLLVMPGSLLAGKGGSPKSQGKWWDVTPEEEISSPYYDSILYSEIGPRLREIEKNSNRVKVDVIGQSAGGRDLFLVTLSDPQAMGRLGKYQAIRNTMLKDPEKAQEKIDKFGDFKVPFFINASIHGGEYPGVDAAIRIIETLAYGETPEVKTILENVILLVNVVQNPDGRVMGTRRNSNDIDINRDFVTQSQPETRATVSVVTEWNPMVTLDLHGFVGPMLIEPCTPPHNPNYEYDLYIEWAYNQALAMEAELLNQTGFSAQIPFRDIPLGWDDWPPIYAAMYPMYHGSYGHTLETPKRDESGVDAHYAAVWGALNFVAENREAMVRDQIEVYRRGALDLPQVMINEDFLDENGISYDQFNELTVTDFPAAYVIPADMPFQVSPHQPARLVDFLLFNGLEVEQTTQSFTLNDNSVTYPEGTYIVWMDQPKRGLAKALLEDGVDLSSIPGLYFYSPPSVWSNSLLWGAPVEAMEEKMQIQTHKINKADKPVGYAEGGKANAYAFSPTSIASFQATNSLLNQGIFLFRTVDSFEDSGNSFGAGTIIVPADSKLANQLANEFALNVFALKKFPEEVAPMYKQRIAVYGVGEVYQALERLGFEYDSVGVSDLNAGVISGYDVFINRDLRWSSLDAAGQASVAAWFVAGGDYVGLAYRGRAIDFANDAGWVDVEYEDISGNAILKIDYDSDDSVVAGFPEDGYAFVYQSVWFTDSGDMKISASIDSEDFLVSGFWADWQTSGANGKPIILHDSDDEADVTLIGIDNTFRAHPEDTFRILGNAIYNGIDQ